MKLPQKVLASILLASVAVTVTQCEKAKKTPKNKANKTLSQAKDSVEIDTFSGNCPACGMG